MSDANIASSAGWVAEFVLPPKTLPKVINRVPLIYWKDACVNGFTESVGWVMQDPFGNALAVARPAVQFKEFIGYQHI